MNSNITITVMNFKEEIFFIKFNALMRKSHFIKGLKRRSFFFSKDTIEFYKEQSIYYFNFVREHKVVYKPKPQRFEPKQTIQPKSNLQSKWKRSLIKSFNSK